MRASIAALIVIGFLAVVLTVFFIMCPFRLRPLSAVISSWFSFNRPIKTKGVGQWPGKPAVFGM